MLSPALERLGILVVEDSPSLLRTLQDILRHHGYDPRGAATGAEGLLSARAAAPAVALVDLKLPDMDGVDVIEQLHIISPLTESIVLTGNASVDSAVEAMRRRTGDYLVKPVAPPQLLQTIERAMERWRRHRAEDALRASEARSRVLLESISDVVVVLDDSLVIRYVSPSVTRVLGYQPEELVGLNCVALAHPDDEPIIRAGLAAVQGDVLDRPPRTLRIRSASGEWRRLETTSASLEGRLDAGSVLLTARDVTERDRLEGHVRQAQRMESIGRVAGGVAHDFNNILAAILGFSEYLLEQTSPSEKAYADLLGIHRSAEHGASLSRQLLAFSSRQLLAPIVLDLATLIEGLQHILKGVAGDGIALEVRPNGHGRCITADPGQIEQVVMNLVVNARDAMPHGGTVTIDIDEVALDAAYGKTHPHVVPGAYVRLSVTDTGTGMPPDVVARIFDPFFTTKDPGKGTGLGLSTVYGIVQQSGGHIDVHSEPMRGTAFAIYFPLATNTLPVGEQAPAEDLRATGPATLLVVEDDDALRELLGRRLRQHGYNVLLADSAEAAVEIMRQLETPLDLLVTDVALPGLSGPALARQTRQQHPRLPIVFMSGYSDATMRLVEPSMAGEEFLQKPFGPSTLMRKVRDLLARNAASPDVPA